MPDATKHPMCLVSHALHHLNDQQKLADIIREYWNPSDRWKCWEYLGSAITPMEMVATPDFMMRSGAKHRYNEDIRLAQTLWPIPRPTPP